MQRIYIAVLLLLLFVPLTASATDELIEAVRQGNLTKVNALLNKGTDANAKDKEGRTVLMYAAAKGDLSIVRALLAQGADVNVIDLRARAALIFAVQKGDPSIVKALLDKGANVNAVAGVQGTALTFAAMYGRTDVVKILLDHRANVNVKSYRGTALEIAADKGYQDIVRLLKGMREPTPTIVITSHDITKKLQVVNPEELLTTIRGRASDPGGIAEVTINGKNAELDATGNFEANVLLKTGDNPIVVTASDHRANVAQVTFTIHRGQALAGSQMPAQQRRIALIIGNSAYQVGSLMNPVNDATDIAETLRKLGFTVNLLRDATKRDMEEAIDKFRERLSDGKGIGLFYYAGHGVQVNGENYLVPIGARLEKEIHVKYEAVQVSYVLDSVEYAGNELNIVILDACRNNPFVRSWSRTRSRLQQEGLAAIQWQPLAGSLGSLIAYSTSPGSVAEDGTSRNGTYTKYLLRYMTTPGLSIERMFKQVRISVMEETGGKQVPWESSSLTGDFYFVGKTGIN
ncbi:MAG: caspase family protein [Candidatus Tectomicrobia bacterium]|nr:caspase family protein [Candidatus Tectomicrobia bacterium]